MITRREFFQKLAAAGIVISLAPKVLTDALAPAYELPTLPDSIFRDTPIALESTAKGSGALTYAQLEEAYQACCVGREEPDLILMDTKTYARFKEWSATIPTLRRFWKEDEKLGPCDVFNNAAVTWDEFIPEGTILEVNSKRREFPMSSMFHVSEVGDWPSMPIPSQLYGKETQ